LHTQHSFLRTLRGTSRTPPQSGKRRRVGRSESEKEEEEKEKVREKFDTEGKIMKEESLKLK
jgi:hypothetical protein